MGKIRVKTIGLEDQEKEEKQKAKARAEAKKQAQKEATEKTEPTQSKAEQVTKTEPIKKSSERKNHAVKSSKQKHSKNYLTAAALINVDKKYTLSEALELLPKLKIAKFDETVELHINTTEKGISGNVTLPHGTGKERRIEVANQTEDPKHVEQVIKDIESGQINFDVLIATPDAMPKLAKVARILGPRGLMPNPKTGTVTPKPQDVIKKFEGGQVNFKTESKFPITHLSIGKLSFGDKKLAENLKATLSAIKTKSIKNVTLKSTMSPGIKIDTASV